MPLFGREIDHATIAGRRDAASKSTQGPAEGRDKQNSSHDIIVKSRY